MVKPTSVNRDDIIPMATGAKGANPRSSGNVMPGPSAEGGSAGGMRGAGGGTTPNPSRNGGIAVSSGGYGQRTGSVGPQAPVTPGNVPLQALGGASDAKMSMLAHGRVLAGIAAIRSVHGDHPHLAAAHAKSSAHIKGYKGGGMKKQGLAGGPKFGALGGQSGSGMGGGGVPSTGSNMGGMPTGMAKLPDEM